MEDQLQQLMEANQKRQSTLELLANEYSTMVDNADDDDDDDAHHQNLLSGSNDATVGSFVGMPSAKEYSDALEVELSLLEDLHRSTTSEGANDAGDSDGVPSFSAGLLQSLVVSQGQSSSAAQQQLQTHDFGEEVLESFHDLDQTISTLQKVITREESKLQSKQAFLGEQETLFQSLQEHLQEQQEKGRKTSENDTTISNNDEASPLEASTQQQEIVAKVERDHQWILQELKYTSQQLEPHDKKTSLDSKKGDKAPVRKKRKRTEDLSSSAPPSLRDGSVEQVVLALLQRLLDDPRHPYLSLEAAYDKKGQGAIERESGEASGFISSIKLLRECGAVRSHPEDENLIRLNDYRH